MIKKLIVVLIGIFIFISCTDDTGLSAESDKNNVEEAVPVKLVVTVRLLSLMFVQEELTIMSL